MDPNLSMDVVIVPLLIIASAGVISMLIVSAMTAVVLRAVARRRAQAIKHWNAQGLVLLFGPGQANFLNQRRAIGASGNGTLVITDEALRFAQVAVDHDLAIPLAEIAKAYTADEFNTRRRGGPYFVVQRKVGDLTGFQVPNAAMWVDALNKALRGELEPQPQSGRLTPIAAVGEGRPRSA